MKPSVTHQPHPTATRYTTLVARASRRIVAPCGCRIDVSGPDGTETWCLFAPCRPAVWDDWPHQKRAGDAAVAVPEVDALLSEMARLEIVLAGCNAAKHRGRIADCRRRLQRINARLAVLGVMAAMETNR